MNAMDLDRAVAGLDGLMAELLSARNPFLRNERNYANGFRVVRRLS